MALAVPLSQALYPFSSSWDVLPVGGLQCIYFLFLFCDCPESIFIMFLKLHAVVFSFPSFFLMCHAVLLQLTGQCVFPDISPVSASRLLFFTYIVYNCFCITGNELRISLWLLRTITEMRGDNYIMTLYFGHK